jgi:hypothetical protein
MAVNGRSGDNSPCIVHKLVAHRQLATVAALPSHGGCQDESRRNISEKMGAIITFTELCALRAITPDPIKNWSTGT